MKKLLLALCVSFGIASFIYADSIQREQALMHVKQIYGSTLQSAQTTPITNKRSLINALNDLAKGLPTKSSEKLYTIVYNAYKQIKYYTPVLKPNEGDARAQQLIDSVIGEISGRD